MARLTDSEYLAAVCKEAGVSEYDLTNDEILEVYRHNQKEAEVSEAANYLRSNRP